MNIVVKGPMEPTEPSPPWTARLLRLGIHLPPRAIISMTVCWIFNVSSAARLSGSTATIIALVPHHGNVEWMLMSRVAEVGWGLAGGVAVVWLVNRVERSWGSRSVPPEA